MHLHFDSLQSAGMSLHVQPGKEGIHFSALDRVDRNAHATGADIVGLLPEEEVACVMEDPSAEDMVLVSVAKPLQAVTIANRVIHRIEPETNVEIFVKGLEWGSGGFSDELAECLRKFVKEQPYYMRWSSPT